VGVSKAYATRVGNGPFPSEMPEAEASRLREAGEEYGATTGRPRRCGWLDLPALRYAARINGLDELVVTKEETKVISVREQLLWESSGKPSNDAYQKAEELIMDGVDMMTIKEVVTEIETKTVKERYDLQVILKTYETLHKHFFREQHKAAEDDPE
jgi:adenylosuccinate synthase